MTTPRILTNEQENRVLIFLDKQKANGSLTQIAYDRLIGLAKIPLGVKNIVTNVISTLNLQKHKKSDVSIQKNNFPIFIKNKEKLNSEFLLLLMKCHQSYERITNAKIKNHINLCDKQIKRLESEILDEIIKLDEKSLSKIYTLNPLGFSVANSNNIHAFLIKQFSNNPVRPDENCVKTINAKLESHTKLFDALNKLQIFNQAKPKLENNINNSTNEIKFYNYRLHLKKNEPILLKSMDNIIQTFLKVAGLALASIVTLGAATYPTYQRLFGARSTDIAKILNVAFKIQKK